VVDAAEGTQAPEGVSKPKARKFKLLPWQAWAHEAWARVRGVVITGGIYTGKTAWAAAEVYDLLTRTMRGATVWWVAPENANIDAMWELFEPWAIRAGAKPRTHPHYYARFPLHGGGRLLGVTADNLNMILSKHPRVIVIDEAGRLTPKAWALLHARFVGVKKLIVMGSATLAPDFQKVQKTAKTLPKRWAFRHVTTLEADIVEADELARLKKELPSSVWDSDILGKPGAGGGNVFKNTRRLATLPWHTPPRKITPGTYEVTWDPAKSSDWSFLGVWRGNRLVWADRWQYEAYTEQTKRVARVCREWGGATCIMDATGPGGVAYDYLSAEGMREQDEDGKEVPRFEVVPVIWTAESKPAMVLALERVVEDGNLALVDPEHGYPYDVVVEEMDAFTRVRSASGLRYSYGAPSGQFDDGVSMVMLRFSGSLAPGIALLGHEEAEE